MMLSWFLELHLNIKALEDVEMNTKIVHVWILICLENVPPMTQKAHLISPYDSVVDQSSSGQLIWMN